MNDAILVGAVVGTVAAIKTIVPGKISGVVTVIVAILIGILAGIVKLDGLNILTGVLIALSAVGGTTLVDRLGLPAKKQ